MLPHAELDNYKLQVQLLQEKLKRSEENRQKLENKLESALHKKNENEKVMRTKQRQKYQEFVNELEKRNERNKQLKQMLERIDQQTSALSARSERLRMMKMQYEMYFAKLVQSQTMRCIQGSTSNLTVVPTPIPVLLPTTTPTQQQQQQSSTVITATPIKNNEPDPTTSKPMAEATASAIYQCDASGNLIAAAGAVAQPISYTLSPSSHRVQEMSSCNIISPSATIATTVPPPVPTLTAGTQHWTLAMATPTPTAMLVTTRPTMGVISMPTTGPTTVGTTASNVTTDFVNLPSYDYMQYPLGYLPRMRDLLLQPKPSTSIYSDESDDLLQPMDANAKSDHYRRTNKAMNRDNRHPNDENRSRIDNDDIGTLNQLDLPTRQLDNDKGLGVLGVTKILRQDNENKHEQQHQQHQQNQQHHQQQQQQHQKPEQLLSNMSTTSSASSLTLDKLPKTTTMTENANAAAMTMTMTPIDERNNNDAADDGEKPKLATHFDEYSRGTGIIGYENKGALPTHSNDGGISSLQKVTTDDSNGTRPSTAAVISNDNGNAIEVNLRRKIDNMMPTQQSHQLQQRQQPRPPPPPPQQQQQQQHMTQIWHTTEESVVTSAGTTPGDRDNALNNAKMTGGFREYAENETTNNGLNNGNDIVSTTTTATAIATQSNVAKPKASIEKIENEIYGELVNPPTSETEKSVARNAAQGLVNELVTQQNQPNQQQQQHMPENEQIMDNVENDTNAVYTNYGENELQNINTGYDQSNIESYDPTYATIEGTTNAEVYQQPGTQMAYTDDQNNANNYAQYALEPGQQDYSNVDYANYDATQYTESGAFDPNAYPGYTYDATTGEYTPDPGVQYTNEDGSIAYGPPGGYEQQQYETSQENQDYQDYANYTQETDNAAYGGDTTATPEQTNTQETMPSPVNIEPSTTTAAISSKPTSILSSADKHAAANDAQKKKKRVNFVDSSETDESSSVKHGAPSAGGAGSESDFDFTASEKSGSSGGA